MECQDKAEFYLSTLKELSYPHVCLFEQKHGGPALGRNLGVEKSKGDIIVFIDSDLVVDKKFLSAHVKSLIKAWRTIRDRGSFGTYQRGRT